MSPTPSLTVQKVLFHSKVARRIFFLFILCALVPLSVLAYYAFNQVTRNLYSQATLQLHQTSKASGMTIYERLQFLETELDLIGSRFPKGNEKVPAHSAHLLGDRLRNAFISIVLSTDKGGRKTLWGRTSALPALSNEEQHYVHSGKTLLLTRSVPGSLATIYLVKASSQAPSSHALFFCELRPEYLWGGDSFLSPLTEFFVLDQSDNMLFSSFPEYAPLDEMKKAREKNPSTGFFTWTYGNDSYLASYWTIFMLPRFHANWQVVQSQSSADILAPISNFRKFFLLFVLLTFFIVILLSLRQIRRSLIPIGLLREATKNIAEKKFNSRVTIRTNDEFEELGDSFNEMATNLENHLQTMNSLNRIGVALSEEKSNARLLELILIAAKTMTSADGCALYILTGDKQLRLSLLHIDSIGLEMKKDGSMIIPLFDDEGKPNTMSALAFSTLQDVTVNIPDMYTASNFDFSRNRAFDQTIGYRSHSFLSVPVKNHEHEVVGVLQLINAQERISRRFVPFSEEDQRLLETLASQAAVALSKNKLIEDFKELFDSLVDLIVTAIDEKSPYTGGHCKRVPELTMMLAEAVSCKKDGVFKDFTLSEEELYELKVAALLHDCGKVTTPAHIADKATRLETIFDRVYVLDTRFEIVKRNAQISFLQKQIDAFSKGREVDFSAEQEELENNLVQIDKDRDFVRTCNSGRTVMDENLKKRIRDIALTYRWVNADGIAEPILSEADVYMLTSAVGTLTPAERQVLNLHVDASIKMLESLHYPKSLRNVPVFAQAHHERMDGKGYPKGLTKKDIPVQGRIIAIADIFEAMTARDRPYKTGKSLMKALSELGAMKQEGHIDPDLFDIFINEKIYLRYAEKYLLPSQIDEVVLSRIPGYAPIDKQAPTTKC